MANYLVNAKHTVPEYAFRLERVKVSDDRNGFYANHPKLGCGKTYPTAQEAICGLFESHGCFNVQIVGRLSN